MRYPGNETPLYTAAREGRAGIVERLLSCGVTVPVAGSAEEAARAVDPLGVAVFNNDEKIVQLLLDRGVEAIGGPHVLHWAMGGAIQTGRARLLEKLLAIEGEDRKEHWAASSYSGSVPMLHFAAGFGGAAPLGVLLAAGASERQCDYKGVCASEYVGCRVPAEKTSPSKNEALRRMLERGPAYRARSRAWPSPAAVGKRTTGKGTLGVRIWRPANVNLFSSRFGR